MRSRPTFPLNYFQTFPEINDDFSPTFRAALAQAVQLHQLPEVLLLNMSLLSRKGSQTGEERAAFLLWIIKLQELGNKGTIGGKSLVMNDYFGGPSAFDKSSPLPPFWQCQDFGSIWSPNPPLRGWVLMSNMRAWGKSRRITCIFRQHGDVPKGPIFPKTAIFKHFGNGPNVTQWIKAHDTIMIVFFQNYLFRDDC